jgi:hypothetical protein
MTASNTGKQVFIGTAHVGDGTTEANAEMLVQALNLCPLQSYDRARGIGELLHDRWHVMAEGEPPFGRDDMAWADIVQWIVRKASDPTPIVRKHLDEVAPEGERARYNEEQTND